MLLGFLLLLKIFDIYFHQSIKQSQTGRFFGSINETKHLVLPNVKNLPFISHLHTVHTPSNSMATIDIANYCRQTDMRAA